MSLERPQTWHYGLVAEYWAARNDGFRPREVEYKAPPTADDELVVFVAPP